MSGGEHRTIPFSQIHVSKLRSGLSTALAGNGGSTAPEGVGDIFLCTDNSDTYVSRDGVVWELLTAGGGGGLAYSGTRRFLSTDATLPGDDSSTYFDWTDESWAQGGSFGSLPGSGINQPEAGFYQYNLNLILENTAAGRWHLEFWYDGGDSNNLALDFNTDGTGNNVILSWSDQFLALKDTGAGGYAYVYLYQDSGSAQNVRAYSSITMQRIGDSP